MQDLDNNSIAVKQRCKRKMEAAGVIQSYAKEVTFPLLLRIAIISLKLQSLIIISK